MAILGKNVATTAHTHLYTVPSNRRSVILISATNTYTDDVEATISIRQKVDYEVGSILIDTEGTNYIVKPAIKFSSGNAVANVSVLNIKNLAFTGSETGYNVGNILTLDDTSNRSDGDVNVQVTVTSVDSENGSIVSFIISENGKYTNAIPSGDDLSFAGGTGVGANLDVNATRYGIEEVTVTDNGDDYIITPTITTTHPVTHEPIGNGVLIAQMVSDSIRKYDAIEYNTVIPFGSVLERSAIVLGTGDSIYVKCNVSDSLNVMVFGVEEIA
jgi:hypothetical protein